MTSEQPEMARMTRKERRVRLYSNWRTEGNSRGWRMPYFPWWQRLVIIRHIKAVIDAAYVGYHDEACRSVGLIPTGYDDWVLLGIWYGWQEKK